MRRFLLLFAVICCACSSEPNTGPSDAATSNGDGSVAADAAGDVGTETTSASCTPPSAPNALSGEISVGSPGGVPAFSPKAVYLIQRAKDPAHPQVMFLSGDVECAALADEGFDGRIVAEMLNLELGKGAPGRYPASAASPPASNASYIYHWGSYTPPNPPPPIQYTRSGEVTVDAYDSTGAKGTFFADFGTDPPKTVRVCGRFDAKPCAVNW